MKRRVLIILAIGLLALLLGVPVAVTRATSPTLHSSLSVSATGVVRASSLSPTGTWSPAGSLNTPLEEHTATVLANGKVLVVGGSNGNTTLASAEFYDPTAGIWSPTGSMSIGRAYFAATRLVSGKVLVVGGTHIINLNNHILASAELYNPATGIWSSTSSLHTGRAYQTATLLTNGKVLVAGGQASYVLASAELYDPVTGKWSSTGSLLTARFEQTATLLASGIVLVAGGLGKHGSLASAELYS